MKIRKIKNRKTIKTWYKSFKNWRELLKISWEEQTKLFFETSTLHGVKYLGDKQRPFIDRFVWFCCLWVSLISAVGVIVSLWEKFQTNPTITGLDTDFQNFDILFPAVALCLHPRLWIDILQHDSKHTNLSTASNNFDFIKFLSYESLGDINENEIERIGKENNGILFETEKFFPNCNQIFEQSSCKFLSQSMDCCQKFTPILTEVGLCYAFNLKNNDKNQQPKIIKDTDLSWGIQFSFRKPLSPDSNIQIFILDNKEIPTVDFEPQHNWNFEINKILFSMKQTYTTIDTKQLSIGQRHCVFDGEINLVTSNMYSYSGCTTQCRMEKSKKKCGCVPPFYSRVTGYRVCRLDEMKCVEENLKEILSEDRCSCQLNCFNTVYQIEKMNFGNEISDLSAKMAVSFFSWPMIRYKKEVLFGWVDLLVSFGGIVGFFLGCSLLTGIETIYIFLIRAVCMVFVERDKLEATKRKKMLQTFPDYDLSLVPYFIRRPNPGGGIRKILEIYYPEIINESVLKRLFIQVAPVAKHERLFIKVQPKVKFIH